MVAVAVGAGVLVAVGVAVGGMGVLVAVGMVCPPGPLGPSTTGRYTLFASNMSQASATKRIWKLLLRLVETYAIL